MEEDPQDLVEPAPEDGLARTIGAQGVEKGIGTQRPPKGTQNPPQEALDKATGIWSLRSKKTSRMQRLVALEAVHSTFSFAHKPILRLEKARLHLQAPRDTVAWHAMSGRLSLLDKVFQGDGGILLWPGHAEHLDNTKVDLSSYLLKLSTASLQGEQAILTSPLWFQGTLKGRVGGRINQKGVFLPHFSSYRKDIKLRLPYPKVAYRGGFTVQRTRAIGASAGQDIGVLEMKTDTTGHLFRAQGKAFVFDPNTIRSEEIQMVIYHQDDSIDHPRLRLRYQADTQSLLLLRQKGAYAHTPFYSSFFDVYMDLDMIRWDMRTENIDMSLLSARGYASAEIESDRYYEEPRYIRMHGHLPFHPLAAMVRYAKNYRTHAFYMYELLDAYGLDAKQLAIAVRDLHQQRFLDFDEKTGYIRLRPRAEHYVNVHLDKDDYDKLRITSVVKDSANATVRLDKEEMLVRGVKRVYITPDNKVYAEPINGNLHLKKGKDFTFDGSLQTSKIHYEGRNFFFRYEDFTCTIDSIDVLKLHFPQPDRESIFGPGSRHRQRKDIVSGEFANTSGKLYLGSAENRSGAKEDTALPRFVSGSDATVYFDNPRVLGGAYDRSIKFVAPPFDVDSINDPNYRAIGFKGTFHGGSVLKPISTRLSLMDDKSLGFTHAIPAPGYAFYGTQAKVRGDMRLDFGGLQVHGELSYQTTNLQADNFVFYLDKATAYVRQGSIQPRSTATSDYPQVSFENMQFLWYPFENDMLLKTSTTPAFLYDHTAAFSGTLNVQPQGLHAAGALDAGAIQAQSKFFTFKEKEYTTRAAQIALRSEDPAIPALRGDGVSMQYDLTQKIGHIQSEEEGAVSLEFPYTQMKTSISRAVWNEYERKITMEKDPDTDIANSYFYFTKEGMDSLLFSASKADYNLSTHDLHIEGIPYIQVADAHIVPSNYELTVQKNGVFPKLDKATLYLDGEHRYHTLIDGNIEIMSRHAFQGSATYLHTMAGEKEFQIYFDHFRRDRVEHEGVEIEVTVSEANIDEEQQFKASAGFYFKGKATLYAHRPLLRFDGYVKLTLSDTERSMQWIRYEQDARDEGITIDFDKTLTEGARALSAGLHYTDQHEPYVTFMQDKNAPTDMDIFRPEGFLSYENEQNTYVVGARRAAGSDGYGSSTFTYTVDTKQALLEGPVNLLYGDKSFQVKAAGRVHTEAASSLHRVEALLVFDFDMPRAVETVYGQGLEDIVEAMEFSDVEASDAFLFSALSYLVGGSKARSFEMSSLQEYTPLHSLRALRKPLVFSQVTLRWSRKYREWYSVGDLALAHAYKYDVQAKIKGYIRLAPSRPYNQAEVFIFFTPSVWYYVGYKEKNLVLYAGDADFNARVRAKGDKLAIPGDYSLSIASGDQAQGFAERFERQYEIDTPLKFQIPPDTQ